MTAFHEDAAPSEDLEMRALPVEDCSIAPDEGDTTAGPNVVIPPRVVPDEVIEAVRLEDAIEAAKLKAEAAADAIAEVIKTQARVALTQLAQATETGLDLGKRIVQGMANVAELLAKGEIDTETANEALSQRMMALENLALAERNEAAQVAVASARETFAAVSSVLLGLLSTGMSIISPAIGVGIAKALGTLGE